MDISAYQHMRLSTRGKRPLRNLTPGDKVRAIQRIHNGETKASVSRDIGVPESTLRGWCKNEQKLRFMCRQLGAAVNDRGLPLANIENPPEKRSKFTHQYEYSTPLGYNRLSLNCANSINIPNTKMDNKGSFFGSNVISDFFKKNGLSQEQSANPGLDDSACQQDASALSASANYSQLSLMQNMHLFSLFHSNLATAGNSAGRKYNSNGTKMPFFLSSDSFHSSDSAKKQLAAVPWAQEPLENTPPRKSRNNCKNSTNNSNDSNNNDVMPVHTLTSPVSIAELGKFPSLFSTGLTIPVAAAPGVDIDRKDDALLDWSKVFNASLSFLALAAAAAAIQAPNSPPTSPSAELSGNVIKTSDVDLSKTRRHHQLEDAMLSYEHSEDSNFESEPEDLSVRSGVSKQSSSTNSRAYSPTRDTLSDASAISDMEH